MLERRYTETATHLFFKALRRFAGIFSDPKSEDPAISLCPRRNLSTDTFSILGVDDIATASRVPKKAGVRAIHSS